MHVLVVGATGYIGSRLVPRLLDEVHAVRVLVRTPAKVHVHPWADAVEVLPGDARDAAALREACTGVDAVVHLVHAMDGPGYADRDRDAARALADGAAAAGVARIVYLGGLQPDEDAGTVSGHLSSRREVGDILLDGPVPATVLRAGIVVGTGSASFEMIRHLTDVAMGGPLVLPLPDRLWNRIQPVAVDDVLHAVVGSLTLPPEVDRAFDIGGPDVLTYRSLMSEYAAEAGLRRPLPLPVPVSAPRLTARAVAALTPVDRGLAQPLVESMRHELVCDPADLDALDALVGAPPGGRTSYRTAVRRALDGTGAAGPGPSDPPGSGPAEWATTDAHDVDAPAHAVWSVIETLGGEHGWYTVPGVATVTGFLDVLAGGQLPRRCSDGPPRLLAGEPLDRWVIETVEPGERLVLRAAAPLPGVARLELRVRATGRLTSRYEQTVRFTPRGLAGRLAWLAVYPTQRFVFAVMAQTLTGVAHTRYLRELRGPSRP
ncbi:MULTISPECIES: DUF2867 domain-containing protein [Pseudonocardia]|uniref:3 beta-hydroxysteroid dehydrogenase/Delta 5-->4-isomerase n=2 Tax=Pseudonocardia TaxID=1847 RepID=A0A1Y2N3K3_PSEAH|nr:MULTISPECIES: DUF2867 domain-containing protein [Pseudonocardia]OSY41761.1 3 beta-hydroxysteroid dehydrogenase/Delta 5-->4-isomerase [Pseudonocardia autotrophica]TDN71187.1 uncharacterized protein YbjT (DUF2867 family) [Pseudonocardia autotrophica]BBG01857.1 NAD(P)-dependent oxidoreductase [Pseudonocardia autotrophica]GEC23023.1 NAD(P)-dependent oxidoreductase [Pseudonocardia saturnea]